MRQKWRRAAGTAYISMVLRGQGRHRKERKVTGPSAKDSVEKGSQKLKVLQGASW